MSGSTRLAPQPPSAMSHPVTYSEGKPVLRFVVPGHPVPYARVVPKSGGRPFQKDEARSYQQKVAMYAHLAARKAKWVVPAKGVRLGLVLLVYREERRSDASNHIKIVEDGINDAGRPARTKGAGSVWVDDRYVASISMGMAVSKRNPRVEVEIRVL